MPATYVHRRRRRRRRAPFSYYAGEAARYDPGFSGSSTSTWYGACRNTLSTLWHAWDALPNSFIARHGPNFVMSLAWFSLLVWDDADGGRSRSERLGQGRRAARTAALGGGLRFS